MSSPTPPISNPQAVTVNNTNGVTIEMWFNFSQVASPDTLQPLILAAFTSPTNYSPASYGNLQVVAETGSSVNPDLRFLFQGSPQFVVPLTLSSAGQQLVIALSQLPGYSVYLNGALVASGALTQAGTWTAITAGCVNYATPPSLQQVGNFAVGHLALYPYELSAARVAQHFLTGAAGQQGVTASAKVAAILAWGNLAIPRAGPTTFSGVTDGIFMGASYSQEGASAADAVTDETSSDSGFWYAGPGGHVVYLPRWALFNQLPVVTFGDSITPSTSSTGGYTSLYTTTYPGTGTVTTGEVPYLAGNAFDYDNSYLYNVDKASRANGPNNYISPVVTSQGSVTEYFSRSSLSVSITTTNDLDAFDVANWNNSKYSQPSLRVRSLVVDAASNPSAAFPAVLSTTVSEVATVNRRPVGGAVITGNYIVQKVSHSIGPGRWQTSYQMSPYTLESSVLTLDNATYSQLGTNDLA